jgi:hypothetical protein
MCLPAAARPMHVCGAVQQLLLHAVAEVAEVLFFVFVFLHAVAEVAAARQASWHINSTRHPNWLCQPSETQAASHMLSHLAHALSHL